jgi:hypothetical protein
MTAAQTTTQARELSQDAHQTKSIESTLAAYFRFTVNARAVEQAAGLASSRRRPPRDGWRVLLAIAPGPG